MDGTSRIEQQQKRRVSVDVTKEIEFLESEIQKLKQQIYKHRERLWEIDRERQIQLQQDEWNEQHAAMIKADED